MILNSSGFIRKTPVTLSTLAFFGILSIHNFRFDVASAFTLLRRKTRFLRPLMNAERVPFEALKERSRVCFGGFRPLKHVEGPRALARGAPLPTKSIFPSKVSLFLSQYPPCLS
jgi:hypothetical protein